MHDRGERVHGVALQQDVNLDQIGFLLAGVLVVERGVALSAGLQHVEEVEDDFTEWHVVAQLDAVLREVLHVLHGAALRLAQLHRGADELLRDDDRHVDDRLVHRLQLAARPVGWVVHHLLRTVLGDHSVGDRRRGGNQVQVELALEAVAGDLHVQQPQEATAETEAQRHGGLGFPGQGGVVKLQLLQRLAERREVLLGDREQARVHHRLDLFEAVERLGRTLGCPGDGVADAGFANVLHTCDEVADLTGAEPLRLLHGR